MLNLFPELFTYQLVAPVILRIVLGIITINLGYLKLTRERKRWMVSFETLRLKPTKMWVSIVGVIEIIGGTLFIIGLYTQLIALIFALLYAIEAIIEALEESILTRNFVFYILLTAIAISLMFLGAGFYAFDLPQL